MNPAASPHGFVGFRDGANAARLWALRLSISPDHAGNAVRAVDDVPFIFTPLLPSWRFKGADSIVGPDHPRKRTVSLLTQSSSGLRYASILPATREHMTKFDHLRAMIQDSSLDLFTTTIACEGVEMPLAKFVELFQGYFVENPLEFIQLVQDVLNKGAFEFDPGDGIPLMAKVVNWGDIRDRE